MSATLTLSAIIGYFVLLVIISRLTRGRGSDSDFYLGNRQSPWFVVAFGMIGASLSGVTFISIPGWVKDSQFSYFQMVLGYLVGYAVIATVLLPLYYRLKLTSIYTYLRDRFGRNSYKTGAGFFLLSRLIGASFRLYLVAIILDGFVLGPIFGAVPFFVPVVVTIGLIWVYTWRSGIRTIIWTDTLQTAAMLIALVVAIAAICQAFESPVSVMWQRVNDGPYSQWFFWDDFSNRNHFLKQFIYGALIAIGMTGLDQDMMQKNLSCRSLRDAQKNVLVFSVILVVVNAAFLFLGGLMYTYADTFGLHFYESAVGRVATDKVFPELALNAGLGMTIGISFIIGLIASAYSSADSALTALTTSFCVDILETDRLEASERGKVRRRVHVGMSVALAVMILLFRVWNDDAVIAGLFRLASFTYGPLLGLYAFGLLTRRRVNDRAVPLIALTSIGLCYGFSVIAPVWFKGYQVLFEVLLLNGLITFTGMWLFSRNSTDEQ